MGVKSYKLFTVEAEIRNPNINTINLAVPIHHSNPGQCPFMEQWTSHRGRIYFNHSHNVQNHGYKTCLKGCNVRVEIKYLDLVSGRSGLDKEERSSIEPNSRENQGGDN